jgi:hypothetical protein
MRIAVYRRFFGFMMEPQYELFESRGGGTYMPLATANVEKMFAIGVAVARAIFDERVVELRLASAV